MKLLILTAMLCNMCVCLFLVSGSIYSDILISQNNKKTAHKEKIHKAKVKKNSKAGNCSVNKCSIV